jgi:hypothetical protein
LAFFLEKRHDLSDGSHCTHGSTNSPASPRYALDPDRGDNLSGRLAIDNSLLSLALVQHQPVSAHQLEQLGLSLGHRSRHPWLDPPRARGGCPGGERRQQLGLPAMLNMEVELRRQDINYQK